MKIKSTNWLCRLINWPKLTGFNGDQFVFTWGLSTKLIISTSDNQINPTFCLLYVLFLRLQDWSVLLIVRTCFVLKLSWDQIPPPLCLKELWFNGLNNPYFMGPKFPKNFPERNVYVNVISWKVSWKELRHSVIIIGDWERIQSVHQSLRFE